MALWIPGGGVRSGEDLPGKLWAPFRCCGKGRGQSWHPRAPLQGWQEVAWGCPCEVPTVAAQPSPSCGRAGEAVCVLGPAGAPLLQILEWGELYLHPEGLCWEGLWATSCPMEGQDHGRVGAETLSHPCLGGHRSWGRDGLPDSRLS